MRCIKKVNNFFIRQKRSFTLIELLLVCVSVSIISLAIYAVLNNGIKIWQRVNKAIPQEDLVIFFDKFSSDLKNSFSFEKIGFVGESDNLEFATFVDFPQAKKTTVGSVIYSYNSSSRVLIRRQQNFSQIYSDSPGVIKQVLENVSSLKLQYYFYDEQRKEYVWLDEWANQGLPLAVRIDLDFDDGTQKQKFRKTVSIPVSG